MDLDFTQITSRFSYNRNACLGGGSFGKVYRGWDQEKNRQIAVKNISRYTLKRTMGIEKRQIEVMEKLKHKNVLQYYGCESSEQDGLFLFLQLCENGCLSNFLQKKHLTEAQALEFLKQIVEGMAYINSKGIFHRDLKPDNLLLTKDNQLKIADFGTAKQFEANTKDTFRRCTPIYSAPQVFLPTQFFKIGEKYDKKCDVFSVGYILYEMLKGESLTKGIATIKQLTAFLTEKRNQGGFKFDQLPNWKPILEKLLDFNIEKRANFDQIANMLQNFEPSKKAIPLKSLNQSEKQLSTQLLDEAITSIKNMVTKNNYLLELLKIYHEFQYEKSELVPRVYKLLTIFYSLGRYCMLSEQRLSQLHNPNTIEIRGQKLEIWLDKFFVQDKKKLLLFIQEKADNLNKALEQTRSIMIRQILPQIFLIFKQPENSPEKIVISEHVALEDLHSFKRSQYFERNIEYISRFNKCVKNMYKTSAQTTILSDSDLKIYLTLLITSKKEAAVPSKNIWPPKYKEILRMSRDQLIDLIRRQKTELNMS